MLQLKKKRLDLCSLFESYLKESSNISYSGQPYQGYYGDEWYDDWYDNWYGGYDYSGCNHGIDINGDLIVYGNKKGKKKVNASSTKRGKRGSKKKCIPLYDNNISQGVFGDSLYCDDEVTIYYYPDINDTDTCEIFYSLHEFSDYLDRLGVYVSKYEVNQIMNRSITYCCIDPCCEFSNGEPWLVTDSSLGGLLWSVGSVSNDDNGYYKDDLPF